jgi:hypothetical protein
LGIENCPVNLKYIQTRDQKKWGVLIEAIERRLSNMEIVNRPVPAKWSKIREALNEYESEPFILRSDFYEICQRKSIRLNKEEADLCLSYLKSLGDLLYFEEWELSDYIFLDHNWLTEGAYYILSDKNIKKNNGGFTKHRAYSTWEKKGYSDESKKILLGLMLKDQFDLCYELRRGVFITPILLPDDKPDSKVIHADLHFRYQYGFMPHGLFSRVMVRLHRLIDEEKVWKTGVRLLDSKSGTVAEVQHLNDKDSNQPVIDIKIKGTESGVRSMLELIRYNVGQLHEDFRNLNVQEMIGCNCPACRLKMSEKRKPSLLPKCERHHFYWGNTE